MLRALGELEVTGVATTTPAHVALLSHPDFAAATHSTKWVEDEVDASVFAAAPAPESTLTGERRRRRGARRAHGARRGQRQALLRAALAARGLGRRRRARAKRSSRPRPGATGAGGSAGNGTISAPMQGTIVKVLVAIGDAVESGQALLVLEAMKMENHINAETVGHRHRDPRR